MWPGVDVLETGNQDSTKLDITKIVARHESISDNGREMLAFEYLRKPARRCHHGSSLSRRWNADGRTPAICPSSRTFLRDPAM